MTREPGAAPQPNQLTRRTATGGLLLALGKMVVGCGDDAVTGGAGTGGVGGSGGVGGATGGAGGAAGTGGVGGTGGAGADGGSSASWATGGTRSMLGNYPDPFPTAAASCVLAIAATEGPCTEAADRVRKDIREGLGGLPMRLALEVVDPACRPVVGAEVKIWHTQITGSYSGNTPNNGMCLKDAADVARHYFRGVQTTDAAGRVDFDSCFPGWYRGRAIHIHYTVSLVGRSFTSQLLFDQALVTDIFGNHAEYRPFGQPDTPNARDSVVRTGSLDSYLLGTARMSDGALLAAKQLVVSLG